MARNKSVLEEALLEAQALEEAVKSNAKEILASTMKEEIEELVKESLNEEDGGIDFDLEDEEEEVVDTPDLEQDFEGEEDFDEEPLDLRGASDDEVLKVFKLMGSDDGVIVTQDDDVVDIKDTETGVEYKVELEESKKTAVNEIEDELEIEEDDKWGQGSHEYRRHNVGGVEKRAGEGPEVDGHRHFKDYMGEEQHPDEQHGGYGDELDGLDDKDEPIYEIELDDDGGGNEGDYHRHMDAAGHKTKSGVVGGGKYGRGGHYKDFEREMHEGGKHEEDMEEGKNWGGNKHDYHREMGADGHRHKTGEGPGGHYKDYEMYEGEHEDEKEEETNEASRTTGFGSKKGRGLRKGFTNNRNLTFKEGTRRRQPRISENRKKYESLVNYTKSQDKLVEKLVSENKNIKHKVNEYKKALGDFRNKINEVAVFNSNLAYATKLFTEHTTSKEEKINIMRRFDEVQSLNESRGLFKRLTSELKVKTNSLNESVKKKITKSPSKGSTNLIESKIYESPQITRIKDMMTKLK